MSHLTHCEEWGTRHPDRGARCLDRVSRRGASPDVDPGIARSKKIPTTPPGCRTYPSGNQVRHLSAVDPPVRYARSTQRSPRQGGQPELKTPSPSGLPQETHAKGEHPWRIGAISNTDIREFFYRY